MAHPRGQQRAARHAGLQRDQAVGLPARGHGDRLDPGHGRGRIGREPVEDDPGIARGQILQRGALGSVADQAQAQGRVFDLAEGRDQDVETLLPVEPPDRADHLRRVIDRPQGRESPQRDRR